MQARLPVVLRVATIVLIVGVIALVVLIAVELLDRDSTPTNIVDKALFEAEEAVRANPESADARIKLAAAYTQKGAYASAIEQADVAIRIAPTNPAGYYALGLAQSKSGESDKAIATLTKAGTMEGQLAGFYADVWASLAKVYEREDQIDKAIEAMDKALNSAPENAEFIYQRGTLYEAQEKWVDALYDYYQATAYVSDHEESLEGIERIEQAHPEAVDEVKALLEENSIDTTATAPAN